MSDNDTDNTKINSIELVDKKKITTIDLIVNELNEHKADSTPTNLLEKKYFNKWKIFISNKKNKSIHKKDQRYEKLSNDSLSDTNSNDISNTSDDSIGTPEKEEIEFYQKNQCSIQYRKLNYHAVERQINKFYLDENHRYSSALDILRDELDKI